MGITISSLIEQANTRAAISTATKRPPLPQTSEELMPVIWKCRINGCTNRVREAEVLVRTQWKWTKATITNGGNVRPVAKKQTLGATPLCPEHNLRMKGTPIVGVFDESIHCGPKCTQAVGTSCRCVCGGAQHGTAVA